MKKSKILGIAIAGIVAVSSIIPAFATEASNTTSAQVESKQANNEKMINRLTERASKLGVDITGLSNEDARAKIQEAQAAKLGIDITGLSNEQIHEKIKAAMGDKKGDRKEGKKKDISKIAEKFGVDITGLSDEEARTKIQSAEASKLGIDTTGLTNKQIQEKIKEMKSNQK